MSLNILGSRVIRGPVEVHQGPEQHGWESKPRYVGSNTGIGDLADILSASSELIEKGVATEQAHQASKASNAQKQAALQAVIDADRLAAQSIAQAASSKTLAAAAGAPPNAAIQAAADNQVMAMSISAEDTAASALPPEMAPQRIAAAQKALGAATSAWQSDPTNFARQNLVNAWNTVLTKAQNVQIQTASPVPYTPVSGGVSDWSLSKKLAAGGIAVGVIGAVVSILKRVIGG